MARESGWVMAVGWEAFQCWQDGVCLLSSFTPCLLSLQNSLGGGGAGQARSKGEGQELREPVWRREKGQRPPRAGAVHLEVIPGGALKMVVPDTLGLCFCFHLRIFLDQGMPFLLRHLLSNLVELSTASGSFPSSWSLIRIFPFE